MRTKSRILIVNDDKELCRNIRDILRRELSSNKENDHGQDQFFQKKAYATVF